MVAETPAFPPCGEHSRLKLLPYGLPALHTPHQLQGILGLTGNELLRVQESVIMSFFLSIASELSPGRSTRYCMPHVAH